MIEELLKRIDGLLARVNELERVVAMQTIIIKQRDAEIIRLNRIIIGQNKIIQDQADKITKLEAKLNTNSKNSSKPPSTDPPWLPTKKKGGKGKRKQGAQTGHAGMARELLPVEEVDVFVPCMPISTCGCC